MEESSHKSSIYTKTGDLGITSLYNGNRISKNSEYFEVLGNIDELNSHIGSYLPLYDEKLNNFMYEIQSRLMDIGSHIATPLKNSSESKINRVKFEYLEIEKLESMIDELDSTLPKLTNFILPIGNIHLSRTICRRAERSIINIVNNGDCSDIVLKYMNRLSDFLFVLARYVNFNCKIKETIYKKI